MQSANLCLAHNNKKTMKNHKPECATNLNCAVYHPDGVCDLVNECNCGNNEPKKWNIEKLRKTAKELRQLESQPNKFIMTSGLSEEEMEKLIKTNGKIFKSQPENIKRLKEAIEQDKRGEYVPQEEVDAYFKTQPEKKEQIHLGGSSGPQVIGEPEKSQPECEKYKDRERGTVHVCSKVCQPNWIKFVEMLDWDHLARAFQEGDIRWHAKEWEEFVETIRKEERNRIKEIISEEYRLMADKDDKINLLDPFTLVKTSMLDRIKAKLEE